MQSDSLCLFILKDSSSLLILSAIIFCKKKKMLKMMLQILLMSSLCSQRKEKCGFSGSHCHIFFFFILLHTEVLFPMTHALQDFSLCNTFTKIHQNQLVPFLAFWAFLYVAYLMSRFSCELLRETVTYLKNKNK